MSKARVRLLLASAFAQDPGVRPARIYQVNVGHRMVAGVIWVPDDSAAAAARCVGHRAERPVRVDGVRSTQP
ncbi:MAG: hypothetical protein NW201_14910 [Gemmatimonadales bacterium]|nr:hypothetical protein [Gemmatimonadales bacterium]